MQWWWFISDIHPTEKGKFLSNIISLGLHNRNDNGRQGPGDGDAASPQDEHEIEQKQQQPGAGGASSLQHHQVGADPEEQSLS